MNRVLRKTEPPLALLWALLRPEPLLPGGPAWLHVPSRCAMERGVLGEGLSTQGPEVVAGLAHWKGRARGAGSVGTGPPGRLRGPGLLGKMWVSFSLPWDALGDFETVRGAVGFRI